MNSRGKQNKNRRGREKKNKSERQVEVDLTTVRLNMTGKNNNNVTNVMQQQADWGEKYLICYQFVTDADSREEALQQLLVSLFNLRHCFSDIFLATNIMF